MNKEQFQGQWNQIKGKIKEKWGKLTDDDLATVNGKREQLIGLLQKKYGIAKERAEQELVQFESSIKTAMGNRPSNESMNEGQYSKQNRTDKKERTGKNQFKSTPSNDDTSSEPTTHGGRDERPGRF